jgi:hypothetical protein
MSNTKEGKIADGKARRRVALLVNGLTTAWPASGWAM